ncbi:MarR family winged helix-turn-helix transcriptional regulator [Pseudogemmobacter sonorensis]|uniref:MarR family winged helix-turn-helix transcriptional regulator n=1 Tax=Pseudogemmobacter sonorensis TaxID=2989681 RepID=UPI003679B16F
MKQDIEFPIPGPSSSTEEHLGFKFRVVANQFNQFVTRRMQSAGLTPPEWAALRLIAEVQRLHPSQLALAMATTRGASSRLVEKLVDRGFVSRISIPGDRRTHLLTLTEAGQRISDRVAGLGLECDVEFFAPLGAEERGQLLDLLGRLSLFHREAAPQPLPRPQEATNGRWPTPAAPA